MASKKYRASPVETKRRTVVDGVSGGREMGRCLSVRRDKFQTKVSSEDLAYSMKSTFKYCIVYLKLAKRVGFKCSQHTHTHAQSVTM